VRRRLLDTFDLLGMRFASRVFASNGSSASNRSSADGRGLAKGAFWGPPSFCRGALSVIFAGEGGMNGFGASVRVLSSLRGVMGFFPRSTGNFSGLLVTFFSLTVTPCLILSGWVIEMGFALGVVSSWISSLTKEISKGID